MCFFQSIHVFRNARVLGPPAEGGREEGDDVCGLEAAAAALEAREEVAEWHLVIEGGLLLQGEDPGVLNDGDEERAPGALDRLDQVLKFYLCRLQALGLGADGVCSIGGDAVVVGRERNCHALEGQANAVFRFLIGVG